ncbi:MAG: hypothetical protein ISS48_00405 [Candidatus Aenigmarchaeota archaeon]|nr:hypothetical protein [Candidatus Aenigmarchaeota archaeon]
MTSTSPNKCVGTRKELMSYIAGLIASDGHLEKTSYGISIATSSKIFANKICNILRKVNFKAKIYKSRTCYVVYWHDKDLQNILIKDFSIPKGNKSDILCPPVIKKNEVPYYLRGFFDGDSSVHRRKMRNKYVPRIRVMSTSKIILEWIKEQLYELNINSGSLFHDIPHGFGYKMNYRLEIYGNAVKKFKEKIDYNHPDKIEKINKLLQLLN